MQVSTRALDDRRSPVATLVPRWPSTKGVVIVVCLVAVSLGLGVFQLLRAGAWHGVLEYDDGVWFGSALRLSAGALPYRDFVLVQPPGVPLLLSPVALLAHLVGARGAFALARFLTVVVGAANIALVGALLRHRSTLCIALATTVAAIFPATVVTDRTVMLEPYCIFFCLVGLVCAFVNGRLATSRRVLIAGVAFGVAGACKAFAVLPFLVLLGQFACNRAHKQALQLLSGAAAGFLALCGPFVVLAPGAFLRQVVLTQLGRRAVSMPSPWARAAHLLGVPPSPAAHGVPTALDDVLIVAVGLMVCVALGMAWRAAAPGTRSFERYAVVTCLATAAGLAWPAAFYYHYGAFLSPFLALPLAVGAEQVLCRLGSRRVAAASAVALLVVGTVHAVRAVQTDDLPFAPDIALITRSVPKNACTASDSPAWLLLAGRFAAPTGCSDVVDAGGSTLAWSGDRTAAAAARVPAAEREWEKILARTAYLVVRVPLHPWRIPWGPALVAYLHHHFVLVARKSYMAVFRQR